jgi:hypothetical protein
MSNEWSRSLFSSSMQFQNTFSGRDGVIRHARQKPATKRSLFPLTNRTRIMKREAWHE